MLMSHLLVTAPSIVSDQMACVTLFASFELSAVKQKRQFCVLSIFKCIIVVNDILSLEQAHCRDIPGDRLFIILSISRNFTVRSSAMSLPEICPEKQLGRL